MKCSSCGYEVDAAQEFCGQCDARIRPGAPDVAGSQKVSPLAARYRDAYRVGAFLATFGDTVKVAGGVLGALLFLVGLGGKDARRFFTRAVYGMICLTLFLSLVGTVLGGIWANDSWGRFWGWDPKENGALLIVLWTLAILHARLGGYIKEWGLHLAAVFTGAVVTFSWWHVNFLNTGLHNYGFTAGKNTIYIFYGVIALILVFGFIARAFGRQANPDKGRETHSQPATETQL